MKFIRKHWSNILFFIFLALLIIPQTRMPIQVFVQRLISFSPSEEAVEDRKTLGDYSWPLHTATGQEVNFDQSENRVVILNFWATWCPPCVAEMPSFQRLYNDYSERVDFYFVTSENPEKVQRFLDKNEYSLPVYYQSYAAPQVLQSQALPTTFLISKEGEIVINETGVAKWDSQKIRVRLDELLDK